MKISIYSKCFKLSCLLRNFSRQGILLVLMFINFSCEPSSQACIIQERYENNKPRVSFCESTNDYKFHWEDGSVRFLYHQDKESPNKGSYSSFNEEAKLDVHGSYLNNQKHGDWFYYDEKGNVWIYSYFWHGKDLYVKESDHQKGTSFVTYVPYFKPNLVPFYSDTLSFEVGLPLPDSLLKNTAFRFVVGTAKKPIKAEDLTFKEGKKIELPSEGLFLDKLKLLPEQDQYLFGYLIDEQKNDVFLLESIPIVYDTLLGKYQVIYEFELNEFDSFPFDTMD